MTDRYDEILAKIGDIPGWEVTEVVYEGSDDTTVVCLAMADIFFVDIVLAPTGAHAYAWAGDHSGRAFFVRGNEYAAAVWRAHAAFLAQSRSESRIMVLWASVTNSDNLTVASAGPTTYKGGTDGEQPADPGGTMTLIIENIQAGIDAFDSCDWTHAYHRNGEIIPDVYCEGDHEDCSYCAEVRASAEEAQVLAEQAIDAVRNENLAEAHRLIEQAYYIEFGWGDAPAYRPAAAALAAAILAK
jgi:hypothetical protein